MLASQVVNYNWKSVATKFKRDNFGNIIESSVFAQGEPVQTTHLNSIRSDAMQLHRSKHRALVIVPRPTRIPGPVSPNPRPTRTGSRPPLNTIHLVGCAGHKVRPASLPGSNLSKRATPRRLADFRRDARHRFGTGRCGQIRDQNANRIAACVLGAVRCQGCELRQVSRGFATDPRQMPHFQ